MQTPRVTLITDPGVPDEHLLRVIEDVGRAMPRGTFAVQVRDKVRERAVRIPFARAVRAMTECLGVAMVVNGDAALARELRADGIHVPTLTREERGALWWSVAAHSDDDVLAALRGGANAVLVSPIFETPGKGSARGRAALTRANQIVGGKLAVLALGGVDVANAHGCFEAGADGVAVVRALLAAPNPARVAVALLEADAHAKSPRDGTDVLTSGGSMASTYDETLRITTEILTSHVDIGRAIKPSDHIQNDLGLDSLGVMEVVADIEDRFEVNIPTDTLSSIATVSDVAQALVTLKQ